MKTYVAASPEAFGIACAEEGSEAVARAHNACRLS